MRKKSKEKVKRALSLVVPIPTNKDFFRIHPEEFPRKSKKLTEYIDKKWYRYNINAMKKLGFRKKEEEFE